MSQGKTRQIKGIAFLVASIWGSIPSNNGPVIVKTSFLLYIALQPDRLTQDCWLHIHSRCLHMIVDLLSASLSNVRQVIGNGYKIDKGELRFRSYFQSLRGAQYVAKDILVLKAQLSQEHHVCMSYQPLNSGSFKESHPIPNV